MTLMFISLDRYNAIVHPLKPSRSTTNMRSCLMILFAWIYALPFCGNMDFYSPSESKINFRSPATPFFEAFGVGGYVPEGFLTACSYDYLNTSSENRNFIFVFAIVGRFKLFLEKALTTRHILAGCVFLTSIYHRILQHKNLSCG